MHSTVGFGSAMVAMALLPALLSLPIASPLVALITATLEMLVLLRYRSALNWRAIGRLGAGTLFGVPLGVLALGRVETRLLLSTLGGVIVFYALYALLRWRLPELRASGWGYGFGFVAGLLGGAYNIAGPPVIIYGNCRQWSPAEFKGNLQAYFLLADGMVIVGHALAGNVTPAVWSNYFLTLPALGAGLVMGLAIERFIHPAAFRTLALVVLLLLGARLLF